MNLESKQQVAAWIVGSLTFSATTYMMYRVLPDSGHTAGQDMNVMAFVNFAIGSGVVLACVIAAVVFAYWLVDDMHRKEV